ncbi:hypothetical protein E2C01_003796 [Portunus trituberculatus]|uniref:Uncharacterized protein n=1 Tax=Portunus trituberculatus TaxID=210409 RepID=A0A5B7CPN5_PORTR|nr:hypothetical protein [Portunus trituberculatus]
MVEVCGAAAMLAVTWSNNCHDELVVVEREAPPPTHVRDGWDVLLLFTFSCFDRSYGNSSCDLRVEEEEVKVAAVLVVVEWRRSTVVGVCVDKREKAVRQVWCGRVEVLEGRGEGVFCGG